MNMEVVKIGFVVSRPGCSVFYIVGLKQQKTKFQGYGSLYKQERG
jgi:hypothetical protein